MKKLTKLAAVAALAATSTGAFAATNPAAAGLTSVGDIVVSIIKGDLVRVSNLANLVFPNTTSTLVDLTASDNVCVYSTLGGYNLVATSPNSVSNEFYMMAGTNSMHYTIEFDDLQGLASGLTHGNVVPGFTTLETTNDTCLGGTNASITATITAADFSAAPAGSYTDLVTLTFLPE